MKNSFIHYCRKEEKSLWNWQIDISNMNKSFDSFLWFDTTYDWLLILFWQILSGLKFFENLYSLIDFKCCSFNVRLIWQLVKHKVLIKNLKSHNKAGLTNIHQHKVFKLNRNMWDFKVHVFWEGHIILRNLHLTFDWHYIEQK